MRKYIMFDFGYGYIGPKSSGVFNPTVVVSRHDYDYMVRINLGYIKDIHDNTGARRLWWGSVGGDTPPRANRSISEIPVIASLPVIVSLDTA